LLVSPSCFATLNTCVCGYCLVGELAYNGIVPIVWAGFFSLFWFFNTFLLWCLGGVQKTWELGLRLRSTRSCPLRVHDRVRMFGLKTFLLGAVCGCLFLSYFCVGVVVLNFFTSQVGGLITKGGIHKR